MVYYVAPGIIFSVLEPPYIIYRNPICKELSYNKINIAAREYPRASSKQMTTYQAVVAQTQSSSSSSNFGLLITSLSRSYTLSTMHHQ